MPLALPFSFTPTGRTSKQRVNDISDASMLASTSRDSLAIDNNRSTTHLLPTDPAAYLSRSTSRTPPRIGTSPRRPSTATGSPELHRSRLLAPAIPASACIDITISLSPPSPNRPASLIDFIPRSSPLDYNPRRYRLQNNQQRDLPRIPSSDDDDVLPVVVRRKSSLQGKMARRHHVYTGQGDDKAATTDGTLASTALASPDRVSSIPIRQSPTKVTHDLQIRTSAAHSDGNKVSDHSGLGILDPRKVAARARRHFQRLSHRHAHLPLL